MGVPARDLAPLLPLEAVVKAIAVRCHRPTVGAGKWIGNSSVSVSATDDKERRRDTAAPSEPINPRASVKLPAADRVVHHVMRGVHDGQRSPLRSQRGPLLNFHPSHNLIRARAARTNN